MAQTPPDTPAEAPVAPNAIVPLFPLPGLFLFPGTALPLHIFEQRYRQMVEDLLDRTGRLVLGTVLPGHEDELPQTPPVHGIAGLGEIARHERYPDGRFLIFVVGLKRVRLKEVASDRLYRKVEVEPLAEQLVKPIDQEDLRKDLVKALEARSPSITLPPKLPLGQMTDLLLLHLKLDVTSMIELYSQLDITQRAVGALERHRTTPIPPPEKEKKAQPGPARESSDDPPVEPTDG